MRSTSQISSTRKSVYDKAGTKKGFTSYIVRAYNYLWAKGLFLYRKTRSLLWIGSTGFIFIILPIAFAVFIESEFESMRLERAQEMAAGKAIPSSIGGPVRRSM